jgi:hypothetical protein
MLVAATTLMDSADHVRRYVRGNLAGGVDHLVVFLDAPGAEGQDEVRAFLEGHDRVTCVRAGRGWWGDRRPAELNERQCTNANVVKELLAVGADADDWVVHLDGDEVARVDRRVLGGLPPEVVAAQLQVREVVSQERWNGEPDLFKSLLDDGDLERLHRAGGIPEPSNRAYFHGHLQGKAAVRAGAEAWLTLHRVVDDSGRVVDGHTDARLEVFHLESYSGAEFVRKWTALARSGPRAAYRPGRGELARAVSALVKEDLPDDAREQQLLELYRRYVHDDVGLLDRLGLLTRVDLAAPVAGEPAGTRPEAVRALEEGLAQLRGVPKERFFHGASIKDGLVIRGARAPRARRAR